MREIKFRAWIQTGLEDTDGDMTKPYALQYMTAKDNQNQFPYALLAEKAVFMQSVDLNDCQGQPIFEDDIVKLQYEDEDPSYHRIVYYEACFWAGRYRPLQVAIDEFDCTIVGNWWENPELREKVEKDNQLPGTKVLGL